MSKVLWCIESILKKMNLIRFTLLLIFLVILYLNSNPEYDPYYSYCDKNLEPLKVNCSIEMEVLKDTPYTNETVIVYNVYLNNKTVKYNLYDSRKHYFKGKYELGNSTCYWDGKDYPKIGKNCSTILSLFIEIMATSFAIVFILELFSIIRI